MNYRDLAAALIVATGVMAVGGLSRATAANSEAVMAFEGHWNGRVILDCAGVTAPMEIVIQGGDMTGQVIVRGQGEGDGTYTISGYIDRKGRISDGRLRGPVILNMRGSLSDHEGKGQFQGPECSGSWKVALDEAAAASTQDEIAAAPASAPADQVSPVIDAPGDMTTEQPVIELAGRVSDASAIVEFTVNGAAAPLEANGNFRLQRGVALGQSELVIAALDEWGNRAERRIVVTRRAQGESTNREASADKNIVTDNAAPMISLPENLETDEAAIDIWGGVVDVSRIVDLRIDGRSVAIGADGAFSIRRGVPVGVSEIRVTALDEWGNEAEQRVRITRRAPVNMAVADSPPKESQIATLGQQNDDKQAPRINLPPKLVTEDREIDIAGSVSDDSAIVEMFVNERRVTLGSDGSFRIRERLTIGINKFAFRATDEWGNKAEKRIDVERKQLDLALGSYHALVIGNNEYLNMPKLKTAVADAEAVSRVLEDRYGFTVTTLINATRYDVIGAMSELRANLAYDTNLLIYYAGHGVIDPVTERGYWLPVEAEQSNSANWVSNDDITDMLKAIPARHILVIADSCYSGTLVRAASIDLETWEDRRDWLKRVVEKRSRTALASGGLEPVADAGSGGHSVFAAALLGALQENTEIIEANELFAPVRKSVVLNANQTPIYSDIRLAGHDGGDFIFAPK
ncbi:MAG: caspase family protein [Proteobacteria bacterium]|nr:caspase family protein [Pseudomonadota bacterium]